MYNGKKMQRGYNQAEILAKEISKYTQIEMYENILTRTRATKPQKDLMGLNRKKNLENAFKISKNVVKLRKILLVDDIYTTGCTIDECAKALLNAGADEVYYVSVCIGTGV
jgi:ComF family protein